MAPIDPIQLSDYGVAQRNRDTTLNNLYTQRATTAQQYGYTPTYNEQGLISALAVDPNNPYAKANILQRSYKESMARNLNSFAARGQLYAGALGVAQGIAGERYQEGSNNLQNAFINFIARNQGQIGAANTGYANAIAAADSAALARQVAADEGLNAGGGSAAPAAAAPAGGYTWPQSPGAYSGSTGYQNWGPNKGKYIDSQGGIHATTTKNGKTYYLASSGKWVPI